MANVHFLRHITQEALWDTIFFAAGAEVPAKERTKDFIHLTARPLDVKIYSNRKILVNGHRCNTMNEAKLIIQQTIR